MADIESYARWLDSTLPSGAENVGEPYDCLQQVPVTGDVYGMSVQDGEAREVVWIQNSVAIQTDLPGGASDYHCWRLDLDLTGSRGVQVIGVEEGVGCSSISGGPLPDLDR